MDAGGAESPRCSHLCGHVEAVNTNQNFPQVYHQRYSSKRIFAVQ